MKIKLLIVILLISSLVSCQTDKSIKKDLMTGLTSKGNGISCENVYLSKDNIKINRKSFIYGEKFYLNFDNITGFKKVNNLAFPGMELLIIGLGGDTIMYNPDLYENNIEGVDLSPLLLKANITVAKPIHSKNNYILRINIWDKKGTGTYQSEMDLEIVSNDKITMESNDISYDEIYLFSSVTNSVVTDNKVSLNEKIFFIFEGLKGYLEQDGKATIGISMKATDFDGNVIIEETDLLVDSTIEISVLNEQVTPSFIFLESGIKNPVDCEIIIWDKNSDNKIKVSTNLEIK